MSKTLDSYSNQLAIWVADLKLDYGLTVAIITLLATWLFFYHQNCKTKQHLCLDEIIDRLELIIDLVKSSFDPTVRHYEIYSGFHFHSRLLRYSIEKFNKSEPYNIAKFFRKKEESILIKELIDLIEYIDLNTPVEAPSNYDLNNTEELNKVKSILNNINVSATLIIKNAYDLL